MVHRYTEEVICGEGRRDQYPCIIIQPLVWYIVT